MTDRLEEIKRDHNEFSSCEEHGRSPQPSKCWLISEVERLRGVLEMIGWREEQNATIAKLRDGSEYWGMNQELTEQIATLREENRILRANMPYGVMKRLVAQQAIAAQDEEK